MAILPTICLLGAVNLAGAAYYNPNVVERDEPTTTGPDYYQTSFGPWAGKSRKITYRVLLPEVSS